MNENIEVLISSDYLYEELVLEIYCDGKFLASLNQDNGIDDLQIEFPPSCNDESLLVRKLSLKTFEKAIETAKKRINQMRNSE
jgi:hypothetical protein